MERAVDVPAHGHLPHRQGGWRKPDHREGRGETILERGFAEGKGPEGCRGWKGLEPVAGRPQERPESWASKAGRYPPQRLGPPLGQEGSQVSGGRTCPAAFMLGPSQIAGLLRKAAR